MKQMVKNILLCVLCGVWMVAGVSAADKLLVSGHDVKGSFPLSETVVVYDEADGVTVKTVAGLFAADVGRVTGRGAVLRTDMEGVRWAVIFGTAGGNRYIRRLAEAGKIDVSPLKDGWERFVVRQVEKPFPGVDEALVIAGSDRRGAAYGAFTLSEKMGVSPFYWWADVPVRRMDKVCVQADYVSATPSVRFRGIFLNDEGWGLNPWAAKTFEKELGNIGPKTYAKV